MRLKLCVGVRRLVADFLFTVRARRAVRRLFCGYCGRDLFCSRRIGNLYCSDQCAERDWARRTMTVCLGMY